VRYKSPAVSRPAPPSPPTAATALLGPQRQVPTAGAALREMGAAGRVAVVTAGWQEREAEVEELAEHLLREAGCEAVALGLYRRAEAVFAADPELAAAHRRRQDELRALQALYRLQLAHRQAAARELLRRPGPERLLAPEREEAVAAVRRLDAHHLGRIAEVHSAHEELWRPGERDAVAAQRRELAELLAGCSALAVAGGHAAVLLNRLRLFGVAELAAALPVAAWSAGAMVLAERVVLFHDNPPWASWNAGAGDAEVLEAGLGRVRDVLPLPHAERRLHLDDPVRVALLARRFAPAAAVALDAGGRGVWRGAERVAGEGLRRLTAGGAVVALGPQGGEGEAGKAGAFVAVPDPVLRQAPDSSEEGGGEAPLGAGESAMPVSSVPPPRTLAARRLEAAAKAGELTPAAVDAFLAAHELPLVEGTTATFAWRGEAAAVRLRHWIYGLPATQAFRRLAGTDLWVLVLEVPERSRIEYKLEVVEDGAARWVRDPLNPLEARDPFGANSVLHGAGYETPEWTRPDPEARPGRFEEMTVDSAAFGDERRVRVHLPARFRPGRRYPLLVVHDGEDYVRYAALATVLDNLVERGEVAPLVVALTEAGGERLEEYADDPRHARFLAEELVPRLEARYPLEPGPAGRGLAGASFGAVAALAAAWRSPGRFGRLLLQSGSFAFSDLGAHHGRGEVFDPVVEFMNRFRDEPRRPAERLFVSCGIYESLIYENRSLVPLLQEAGLEVRYREARDGHNWENWRDRLREGLSWLFPGPLWMVYE
jgi:enterochelin esterase-like enzyme